VLSFSVTFLITVLNLTVLYFVLKRVLFKPVTKFMEDRANRVQRDIDAASQANARAEELKAEYEAKLRGIAEEGQSIIQASREKAKEEAAEILAQAQAQAAKLLETTRESLEEERREVELALRGDLADLSIMAASSVVAANMDSDRNRELVKKFIASVGAA
jgi:ATP synthase, F0 subunit b